MKILIIAFALFGAIAASSSPDLSEAIENVELGDFIGNLINGTINKIIEQLSEPMVIDDIHFENETESLSGLIDLSKIKIFGLKQLCATNINCDLISHNLNFTIEIPDVNAQFSSDIDVVLMELIPLYWSGKNSLDITGIRLDILGKVTVKNVTKIKLSDLSVMIHLDEATFNLNGLLHNPELSALVNTVLNDNIVNLINDNAGLLSDFIAKIIEGIFK